ncbi:MAG: hypothetical protein AAF065_14550 [Verrucomicrobiota bacterium]
MAWSAFALAAITGCAPQHKDAIMFGINTQVGVKVGVDEKQVPTVIVGFNRQEAALVPLLTYGDGMLTDAAYRDLDTSTYLHMVAKYSENLIFLTKNSAAKAVKDPVLQSLQFATERALESATKLKDDGKTSVVDPLFDKLNNEALALTNASTVKDITRVRVFAESQLSKPSLAQRFHSEMKYTAEVIEEEGGKNSYKDAYSVLGIFSGKAKGSAKTSAPNTLDNSSDFDGQLAQYFATGMAAQNLSKTPAAVSTNAAAVEAASNFTEVSEEELASIQKSKEQQVQTIYTGLLQSNGSIDKAKVDKLYQQPDGLVRKVDMSSITDNDSLKGYLDTLSEKFRLKSISALELLQN